MIDIDSIFKYKKSNKAKLFAYGFAFDGKVYVYQRKFFGDDYLLTVGICAGKVDYKVTDTSTGDEYTLVKAAGASGAFVGDMRLECEKVLREIAEKCFDTDKFKSGQTQRIVNYIRCDLGAEPEYLWDSAPESAVFRHDSNEKWFAIIMNIDRSKIDKSQHGMVEIINLKASAETVSDIVDGEHYYKAYHMNKKYWYSVPLDGTLDDDAIIGRIGVSYDLTEK